MLSVWICLCCWITSVLSQEFSYCTSKFKVYDIVDAADDESHEADAKESADRTCSGIPGPPIRSKEHSPKGVVFLPPEEQHRRLTAKLLECYRELNQSNVNITGAYCERVWDNLMCWSDTPAGAVVQQPCPSYINRFDTNEYAVRICLPHGTCTWWSPIYKEGGNGWTNYSGNFAILYTCQHIVAYRLMYNIGYGISLVSLILAVVIMIAFKKLHCSRNYIHLNLFVAFLLRASMNMVRENIWVHGLGFPKDVEENENGTVIFKDGPHWECRLFYTVYQYVLMSSYIWIFVEAVYLHMIIFVAVFTEKTKIIWYMLFGWSVPLPFAVSWAIARIYTDNTLCWNTSTNSPGLTWINKVPVMITVVLNFFCFINIVWLLFTKLSNSPCPDATRNRYRRLARSVLVLIPVFGVYYLVFTWPMGDMDDTASFVMLFVEMFFNSYQGLIIAILLCFVNGEVRTEIKKAWARRSLRRSSTVTRYSHAASTTHHRKSSAARVTDSCTTGHNITRRAMKSSTSFTSLEECVPLTQTPAHMCGANLTQTPVHIGGTIHAEKNGDVSRGVDSDGHNNTSHDELQMTIKIVNIECESSDGNRKNTTSLDIQTLKNGRTVGQSKIVNNNSDSNEFKDSDETTSFLDDGN